MHIRTTRRRFVAGALAAGAGIGTASANLTDALAKSPGPTGSTTNPPIAIAGATVIDATGADPIPNATVLIEGDRIAAVGPVDAVEVPAGARVIDGAGRFLIPGLWDAHVHAFVFPWQAELYLPLLIANGVTGVRDMGGPVPMAAIDEVRAAVAAGERVGPRIVAGTMLDGPTPVWPFALPAGTAEEGRAALATVADSGADFAKVYTLLPREAFLAVAEAAGERGFPFAGHVPITSTPVEAAAAGQRTVEHYSDSLVPFCAADDVLAALRAAAAGPDPVQAYGAAFFGGLARMQETLDEGKVEAAAAAFADHGTWFTPTLIIGRNAALAGDPALVADPRLRYLPPEVVATWATDPALLEEPFLAVARQSLEIGTAMTATMRRAGVGVLAGTDLGLPNTLPGFGLHDELALLVDAGLTPLEALQAATRNPAEAVGRAADLGTVEAGKLADLVLLDADPLADIGNAGRIAAVIADGRVFARADLDALLTAAEHAAAASPATPGP